MINFPHNSERGQAMILATVFFVVISTTILLSIGVMTATSGRLVSHSVLSEQAYYIAEAGAESVAYNLLHGNPPNVNGVPTIAGVKAQVQVATEGDNKRITSTASFNGAPRRVEILLFASTTGSRILSWKEQNPID